MRWDRGREVIDRMLADRELQRVPASREHADRLILQARKHLVSADEISEDDPAGGYTLVYDAARKALTAVLETKGCDRLLAAGIWPCTKLSARNSTLPWAKCYGHLTGSAAGETTWSTHQRTLRR